MHITKFGEKKSKHTFEISPITRQGQQKNVSFPSSLSPPHIQEKLSYTESLVRPWYFILGQGLPSFFRRIRCSWLKQSLCADRNSKIFETPPTIFICQNAIHHTLIPRKEVRSPRYSVPKLNTFGQKIVCTKEMIQLGLTSYQVMKTKREYSEWPLNTLKILAA